MVRYSKTNNVIEINENEYFKMYKDIIRTCLEDGYVLPGRLEIIEVPEEYDYTYEEKLDFKISVESSRKRQQMMMERELRYADIDVEFSDQKNWSQAYIKIENEELLEFISSYPQFKAVLK